MPTLFLTIAVGGSQSCMLEMGAISTYGMHGQSARLRGKWRMSQVSQVCQPL